MKRNNNSVKSELGASQSCGGRGGAVAQARPRLSLRRDTREALTGIGLLLPLLALITMVVVWPVIQGIGLSFTDAHLLSQEPPNFVGLANFIKFFGDPFIRNYVKNTLVWSGGKIVGQFTLGLVLALLCNRPIRFRAIWRALLLVPWAMPVVVTSISWRWILDGEYGILNKLLVGLGILSENVAWLSNVKTMWPTVIGVHTWQYFPFMYVSFLAGLQMISPDLYEAGELDGASRLGAFRYITWPMLRPVVAVNGLLAMIWSLSDFAAIFTLTQGGPGGATTTLAPFIYLTTFKFYDTGYGSTMAVILMLTIISLTIVYLQRVEFDIT